MINESKIQKLTKNEDGTYSVVSTEGINNYINYEVDWREVPRYNPDGSVKTPADFQAEVIAKYGIVYFNQNYGCILGSSNINIYDRYTNAYKKVTCEELKELIDKELYKKVFDARKNVSTKINDRYMIETQNGYETFDGVVSRGVKNTLKFTTEKNNITVSDNHIFVVDGNSILCTNLKIGNYLETKNGLEYITNIESCGENEVFDILDTTSHTYIANDINHHNCDFVGSSYTLLSSDTLAKLSSKEPEEIWDGKLKIYHKPEPDHQYIMSVDPAKDGRDAFSVDIIDITGFKFRQVASANIQIDYLLMPEYLFEWAQKYHNPYLIIENNEGAGQSIADQLFQNYEYENLHFDRKTDSNSTNLAKSKKRYPGTRTTPKTRRQILQTMKTFVENNNLEINDETTIKEFYSFVLVNNKYQADEGTHDDSVMSLALAFTIFNNTKNFEDMRKVAELLYQDKKDSEEVSITDIITVGSFDDGTYENTTYADTDDYISYEEYVGGISGFV